VHVIRKIIISISLFQFLGLSAQNLVPNPSFETYTACPTASSGFSLVVPWYGTNNSTEYYNACNSGPYNVPYIVSGFQYARTGVGVAGQWFLNGFGINYREYIQVQLTNSLVTGNCYLVKFYINYPNNSVKYACNNFASFISTNGFTTNGSPATSYTPQIYLTNNPIIKDTLNWIEIGGVYTASGGEKFITIGNFKNDNNTDTLRTNYGTYSGCYYYIDDVLVEQITTPQWQLKDTMIIGGDSVLIGPLYSGLTCNWFDMLGTPIGSGAGFWVKPTTTTNYVLQQTFCNTTFSDTVTVYVSAVGIKEQKNKLNKIKLYPNPTTGLLNVEVANAKDKEEVSVEVFDLTGKLVYSIKQNLNNGTIALHPNLNSGTYLVKIKLADGTTDIHRLVISK
jgi:hypothetical protein